MTRTVRMLPMLVLCLALGPMPAFAQSATPAAGGAWTVAEEREIVVDGVPMAMSPDGDRLFGTGPDDDVCIWEIETFEPTCHGLVPGLLERSVQWAPDSSAIAFSVDTPRSFRDSDVLVFEVESGTVENLTDEPGSDNEFDAISLSGDGPAYDVDLYPSWSPDSSQLIFARSPIGPDSPGGTVLMTIGRAGDEPEEVAQLTPPEPLIVFGPMAWNGDDEILFPILRADPADPQNGIYRLPLDGRVEQLVSGRETDLTGAIIGSVSDDGERASVISLLNLDQGAIEPGASFHNANLTTGETGPWEPLFGLSLEPSEALSTESGGLLAATPAFGVGSNDVVFLTRGNQVTVSLHIDATGETFPLTELEIEPGVRTIELGADWAANDTIFIGAARGEPSLLLVLEPAGPTDPAA